MKIRKALCGFLIAFAIPFACMAAPYVQEKNNANVAQGTESAQNMPSDGMPQRGGGGRMGGGRGGAPVQNGENPQEMPALPNDGEMTSPQDDGQMSRVEDGTAESDTFQADEQASQTTPDADNQEMTRGGGHMGGGMMRGGQGGMGEFGQQTSETKLDRVKAFCSENFTPLFSLASLLFGFFFVILYKRKKY